jgi:hypothetical protein
LLAPAVVVRFLGMNKFNDDELPDPSSTDEPGEGNREADRRYREATRKYVDSGAVDPAAKEARRAVDDEREGKELKEAEKAGKSHRADLVGEGGAAAPATKK